MVAAARVGTPAGITVGRCWTADPGSREEPRPADSVPRLPATRLITWEDLRGRRGSRRESGGTARLRPEARTVPPFGR
jgi:hypothetical protein